MGPYWVFWISSIQTPMLSVEAIGRRGRIIGMPVYDIALELPPMAMPIGEVTTLRIEHRTVDGMRDWESQAMYMGQEGLERTGVKHRWVTRGAIS